MKKNYYSTIAVFLLFIMTPAVTRAQCSTPTTVPYYENFSSITQNNQLPTCWAASNPSVTCLTFTAPNNYAAFFYNPGGMNYFYSKGIQLYSGVTYSAALWYKTDNTGSTNWTNLAILRGTSQSPTGLAQIASTPGPANSAAYTPLSNTFFVPTSGVYYLAIRATGSNTASSQYLSWDDLSITIPCGPGSGNSPNLVGIPSQFSATICSQDIAFLNASITGPYSYSWSTGATTPTVAVAPLINTTYSVTITNTITICSSTYTYYIAVNPTPSITVMASHTAVCKGAPVIFTATGANNIAWSIGATGPNATVHPSGDATYSISGVNSFGCPGSATVGILVKPLPSLSITTIPATICEGEQVTLNVSGAVSYTWNFTGGPSNSNSITVTPSQNSNYIASGTGTNGCVNQKTVSIQLNACTEISEFSTETTIKISPNPNQGTFVIENSVKTSFFIYDLSGREILNGTIQAGSPSISIADYPAGIYFLKTRAGGRVQYAKILKE